MNFQRRRFRESTLLMTSKGGWEIIRTRDARDPKEMSEDTVIGLSEVSNLTLRNLEMKSKLT